MGNERGHEPPVEEEGGRSPRSGRAKDHDSRGQVQSAEWTTSTYRSSRRLTDIPGKASKPARRKPPDTDAQDDEHADEEK